MIGDRRAVLPTPQVLNNLTMQHIAFQPLCESAARGESVVIGKLRSLINTKLSVMIGALAMSLMAIAVDKTQHSRLTPDQAEFLKLIDEVQPSALEGMRHVIEKMDPLGEHRFVNIYPRRKGSLKGVQYMRVAIVTFPVLDARETKDLVILGAKIKNQKDKKAILALLSYILNQTPEPFDFSFGSLSGTAPFFHALINAYANVALWLNDMLYEFRDFIPYYKEVWVSDMEWTEQVKNLDYWRGLLPTLPGNEGEHLEGSTAPESQFVPSGAVPPPPTPERQAEIDERARKAGFIVGGNRQAPTAPPVNPNPALGAPAVRNADPVAEWTQAVALDNMQRANQQLWNSRQGQFGQQPPPNPYNRTTGLAQPQGIQVGTGQQVGYGGIPVGGQHRAGGLSV